MLVLLLLAAAGFLTYSVMQDKVIVDEPGFIDDDIPIVGGYSIIDLATPVLNKVVAKVEPIPVLEKKPEPYQLDPVYLRSLQNRAKDLNKIQIHVHGTNVTHVMPDKTVRYRSLLHSKLYPSQVLALFQEAIRENKTIYKTIGGVRYEVQRFATINPK